MVTVFAFHPQLIQWLLDYKLANFSKGFETRYGHKLSVKKLNFVSLKQITADSILISNSRSPDFPVLFVQSVDVGLDPWDFVFGGHGIARISVGRPELNLIKYADSTTNFLRFVRKTELGTSQDGSKSGIAEKTQKFENLLEKYFRTDLPELRINNGKMTFLDSTIAAESDQVRPGKKIRPDEERSFKVEIVSLYGRVERQDHTDRSDFKITARIIESSKSGSKNLFEVEGEIDHESNELLFDVSFSRNFSLPLVETLVDDLEVSFKSARFHLFRFEKSREADHLKAEFEIKDFAIFAPPLSNHKLDNINFGFELDMSFVNNGDGRSLLINAGTRAYLNEINCRFAGGLRNYETGKPKIEAHLAVDTIACSVLHNAIPFGLISKLKGMRVEGDMALKLDVGIDLANLDSIDVGANLYLSEDFRISYLGDSIRFKQLEKPFRYRVELEDETDSLFLVATEDTLTGEKNPDFVPYDSLNSFVVNATLTNEDASFYKHKGFNVFQIERSIADNIEAGGFVRGASTISMQLVKNLFLTREKTLARKFQEVLITWIMEHGKHLSKQRMLEIYFNVIEWGPDIYGIQAASRYYFRKDQKDLTIPEATFLAILVPSPRKFAEVFETGDLSRKKMSIMNFIIKKMSERALITLEEFDESLPAYVILKGAARLQLRGYEPDTTFFDSLARRNHDD